MPLRSCRFAHAASLMPLRSNCLNLLGNHRRAHQFQQFVLPSCSIVIFALMHLWRAMRITVFLLTLACNRYKREICLTTTERTLYLRHFIDCKGASCVKFSALVYLNSASAAGELCRRYRPSVYVFSHPL